MSIYTTDEQGMSPARGLGPGPYDLSLPHHGYKRWVSLAALGTPVQIRAKTAPFLTQPKVPQGQWALLQQQTLLLTSGHYPVLAPALWYSFSVLSTLRTISCGQLCHPYRVCTSTAGPHSPAARSSSPGVTTKTILVLPKVL